MRLWRKIENHDSSSSFKRPEIIGKTERQVIKKKVNFKPVKTVFYLIIAVAVVYWVVFSPFFRIKNIVVEGVKSVEIADYLKISLTGKNILFFLPGRYLENLTQKFPILQESRIVRGIPNTVKVIVAERKQVLVWCSNKCVEIDSHGIAYQEVLRPSDRIVLDDKANFPVKVSEQVVSGEFISFYLSALEQMEQMGLKITESRIEETVFKVIFKTSENWEIVLDSSESLKNQISALKQVLETNRADIKEYVDVRVPGTVFVK